MRTIFYTFIATLCLLPTPAPAQEARELRAKLDKWIEVNRLIAEEQTQWQTEKALLNRMIELLEKESAMLDQRIEDARTSQSATQRERQRVLERQEQLAGRASAVQAAITTYEAEIRSLTKHLPPPLLREIDPLLQQVPQDSASATRSLGERTQTLLSILEAV